MVIFSDPEKNTDTEASVSVFLFEGRRGLWEMGRLGVNGLRRRPTRMIDFHEITLYNDQPTTCPRCGGRTEILLDFSHTSKETQIHKCLSLSCTNEFITQKDIE